MEQMRVKSCEQSAAYTWKKKKYTNAWVAKLIAWSIVYQVGLQLLWVLSRAKTQMLNDTKLFWNKYKVMTYQSASRYKARVLWCTVVRWSKCNICLSLSLFAWFVVKIIFIQFNMSQKSRTQANHYDKI